MKQRILLLMLSFSIAGTILCQTKKPAGYMPGFSDNLAHSIFIELEDGNTMRIDQYGKNRKPYPINIDSLVDIIVDRMSEIKDSLASAEYVRQVTIDLYGTVADRVMFFNLSPENRYLLRTKTQRAYVKPEQDTIRLNAYSSMPGDKDPEQFYQLSFYLNDIGEISNYGGRNFNTLFNTIKPDSRLSWKVNANGFQYMKDNPSVQILRGHNPYQKLVGLTYDIGIGVQNYANSIIPSFHLGLGWAIYKNFKVNELRLGSESLFAISKNDKGERKVYRNEMVYLAYRYYRIKAQPQKLLGFTPYVSVGLLTRRKSEVFDRHTMRFGVGEFYVGKGMLRVEPMLFFRDGFKGVMPSLKLVQSF